MSVVPPRSTKASTGKAGLAGLALRGVRRLFRPRTPLERLRTPARAWQFPAPTGPGFPGNRVGNDDLGSAAEFARFASDATLVEVDLRAAEQLRVRLLPVVLVNTLLLGLALDLGGSLYLREATGIRLFDMYRGNLTPPTRSVVSDAKGTRLGAFAAPQAERELVAALPQVFEDALVRWEDARFYAHDGVDRFRMLGALTALLQGDPQGGSTITMQLAKLMKRDSARTLRRKLEDIALALALDHRLGKEAVLLRYANEAYFGSGVYGLGEACRFYFGRPRCEDLTLAEAAYLVCLLRAPADLSKDEGRAQARRNLVLEQLREPAEAGPSATAWQRICRELYLATHALVDHALAGKSILHGVYSDAEIDLAKASPLGLARKRPRPAHPFVLEAARQELQKQLGQALYEQGFDVRLTIDAQLQRAAEQALVEGLDAVRQHRKDEESADTDDLDGGLVIVDPRNGRLLAYVPGGDFASSQVPFAARPIQVGSSLKPFVYGEFFERGLGDLDTVIPDAPLCIGGWCPKNYDGKYRGPVALRSALPQSLNTVAVRVAQKVGVDSIAARLRLLGVQSPLTVNLPMALGASELTLLELGGLFSALYDGGVVRPHLVDEVRDRADKVVITGWDGVRPQAFKARTLEMLHEAMARVAAPGGTAFLLGRDLEEWFGLERGGLQNSHGRAPQLACKTGTHDGFTRAGLGCIISDTDVGPVAVVTYLGHRTPRSLGEGLSGGKIAAPILARVIRALTARGRETGAWRPFPTVAHEAWEDPAPPAERAADPLDAAERVALGALVAARELPTAEVHADAAAPPDPPESPSISVESGAIGIEPPRDWPGLRVLNADVIEADGEDVIGAYFDRGGREDELPSIATLLGLTIDQRVLHKQRLLERGFTDRPIGDRMLLLGTKVAGSLERMISEEVSAEIHEHPDALTHIIANQDVDRRVERVFSLSEPLRLVRVTRHQSSRELLALELVDATGARRSWVRRGDRLVALATRHVSVKAGSLEPAWLGAGLASSQLDALQALLGESVDIDRIPRGFELDVVTAEGQLVGVEATAGPLHVSGVRIGTACVSGGGMPCATRLLPLPFSEAVGYDATGSVRSGRVIVQRDQAGASVMAPTGGRVLFTEKARGLVVLETVAGEVLRLDGVIPGVDGDAVVAPGTSIGTLDARGMLLVRRLVPDRLAHLAPAAVSAALTPITRGDASLRAVARWWTDASGWLRGSGPEARRGR